jgi:hypothetical protein
MKKQVEFPPGWDEERVRRVLAFYEEQTEEEAVAEDEAAFENLIEEDMLKEIIIAVEEWLDRQELSLTPAKKADLVITLCHHFREEGEQVNNETVGRSLLKLVA